MKKELKSKKKGNSTLLFAIAIRLINQSPQWLISSPFFFLFSLDLSNAYNKRALKKNRTGKKTKRTSHNQFKEYLIVKKEIARERNLLKRSKLQI